MMSRQDAIDTINDLYPADSPYNETQEIGQKLMLKAIAMTWRELPDETLKQYARLCLGQEMLR